MNYLQLVQDRESIREFRRKDLDDDQLKEIKDYFSSCKKLCPDMDVKLGMFDHEAAEKLANIAGYHGHIISAPYYLVLFSEIAEHYLENAGFMCEDMILKLTEMDLDSCWLTFQSGEEIKEALDLHTPRHPAALIAFGYGKRELKGNRLDIKSPSDVHFTPRDGHIAPKINMSDFVFYKTWGESPVFDNTIIDEGLHDALYAASLSPSFLNRQPYRLLLDDGCLVLVEKEDDLTTPDDMKLNLGAVMLNFAAALAERRPAMPVWKFGLPEKEYHIPDGYRVAAYCEI